MKGTIRLIPATEISEGKPVIYGGWKAVVSNYVDSITADINISERNLKDQKRVYKSDLKVLVMEYFKLPMPPDRSFQRGYSVTKYNHDMAIHEASRRTILLNPIHWQSIMDKSLVNRRMDFTESDNVANIENFDVVKK